MKDQEEIELLLLKALKKEPIVGLPLGFAAMVTRKVLAKPDTFRISIMAVFLGLLVSTGAFFCLLRIIPNLEIQIFRLLYEGKFIIGTIIAGFLMVQYLERRFVKPY